MLYRREFIVGATALLAPGAFTVANDIYDVIIVGSGAAGLSATVSALQNGAKNVLVLEKARIIGGHSILSTGYVSAVDNKRFAERSEPDSPELMLKHMLEIGGNKNDIGLARLLCEESRYIIDWLEEIGVRWLPEQVQTAAGLYPRSHISNTVRAGYDYITALNKYARKHGAKIILNAKVVSLIGDNGRVCGVNVSFDSKKSVPLLARNVILATGGFTANVRMRTRFDPRLDESYKTTANPLGLAFDGATGDAIEMAEPLGADLKDAEYIQFIPFAGGRLLDYVGGDIFINKLGRRFVSESAPWREISEAILKQPDQEMWSITDSQSHKGASLGQKLMNQVVFKADTIEEMAAKIGCPNDVLTHTIEFYNKFARYNQDPLFNKNRFTQTISKPPYYFGAEKLCVHFCCGGIRIDEKARAVRKDHTVIKGLYVCGEAAGGPHGHDRMGGVAMTSAFVFGRIAGRECGLASGEEKNA